MLKKRVIVLVVAILLAPLAIVQADTNDRPDLCGSLPQSDCQILLDNEDSWKSLTSLGFMFWMNMDVEADEAMQLSMQGSGAFEIDAEANQTLIEMDENLSAVDVGALVELMLTSIEGEISFELSVSGGDEDLDAAMTLLMKDGVVIIDAAALEELTGESMGGVEALGIDLNGAVGEMYGDIGVMDLSGINEADEAEVASTTITRLPDEELRGVAVAVFETTIDLETFFSLVSVEEFAAAAGDLDDTEDMQLLIDAMETHDISMREYIGLDDHYTYLIDVSLDMTLAGDVYELDSDGSIVMDMSMEVFDFNEPVEVEIPEDAFVFPLAMMMAMGSE